METQPKKKTQAEFQQDTEERFARHDAMLERILGGLQKLTTKQDKRDEGQSGGNPKPYLKLQFPRFGGEDPRGWLYQAEQYFEFQRVAPVDQVQLASIHMDGIALQWHRWITKFRGPMTWTTTVIAYQEAFERISHQIDGLPEVFLVGCFVGGLKEEIRLEVKLKKPRNLSEAIGMALLVEEKINLQRKGVEDEVPINDNQDLAQAQDDPHAEQVQAHEGPHAEISFHAISGSINPQTLRLPGRIKNKDVVVLVDGGSTHNFIDQALVDRFGLTVERDVALRVMVANREHVSCIGRVRNLEIAIQGYVISTDFFVLPVAACPIVLGVQWLKTLGLVEIDYEQFTMGFKMGCSSHTFRGLKGTPLATLKTHEFMRIQDTAFLLQISSVSIEHPPEQTPCPTIQPVLTQFAKVQPYLQKTEIEKQVCELLQQGLIRPSHSPFSSPVLLVKKLDGTWRFCVDYRSLNDVTVKDKYPIPQIDELLDELHGSRYYSKLDLRFGYHQIRVRDDDIHKTVFKTHEGHYEFVVMPFGLTNTPATFQSLMNDLFRPYLRILEANQLYAKESKCCFGVTQVNYLGHIISANGVAVESEKVQAVSTWPTPTSAKGVQGFLGLAGYYHKFIKGFGGIAAPLHKLLGKVSFQWDGTANQAFEDLKKTLTTAPTLGLPNWSIPFTIECDASGVGIGAVLTQNGRPLAYFSALLKGIMLAWSTYEKEMLALVKSRITTPAQARWLPKLLGYDYKIEYKKGNEVKTDSYYSGLPSSLPGNSQKGVVLRDGVWFRGGAILLSPTSTLLLTVLEMSHSLPEGGHFGFHKTLAKVKQSFWWIGVKERVKRFIRECSVCQRYKHDSMKPARLLQPLPVPERIWENMSMDFVEGLPNSQRFTVAMVMVDRLSKYAYFIPLRHPFTTATIAREFVSNIVKLHGMPATVVSDRDKVFISSFWQNLFKSQGTTLCMSSSYHPQIDGQTEVVNRTLEQYLRCFASDKPKKWVEWLPWVEYSYNTSMHSSTKLTPFQVVYGRASPKLIPYIPGTSNVQAVDDYLTDRDALLRHLRANLLAAQHRMKTQADQHRRELEFEIGDYVYVKLQPYRHTSVAHRESNKLSPQFWGPYRVIERVGPVAYRIELPPGSLIHDVFHISLLRRCVCPIPDANPPPSVEAVEAPGTPQPACILDERVIQKGKYRPKTELLVKWVGCPREDATWETKWRFARSYPNFRLESKANVSGVD
nr:Ty3/gypsy retrotransposon protein [Tanacetum cinerariifolium]